jgi:hypothetical protein
MGEQGLDDVGNPEFLGSLKELVNVLWSVAVQREARKVTLRTLKLSVANERIYRTKFGDDCFRIIH